LGDEIFYAAMVEDLLGRGHLIWEADPRLLPLIQRTYPGVAAVARVTPPDHATSDDGIAAQVSTASLGQYVRKTKAQFPKTRRAYLQADKARAGQYRERLLPNGKKRLIGVSWLSQNPHFGMHKSSALTDWAPIWTAAGAEAQFVDLQYGDTASQRAAAPLALAHLDDLDLFNDIDGLAALIAACDQVITVSNTTAHLAGALGVAVSVLVPAGNGNLWYWSAGMENAWYPSARIFRQTRLNAWDDVVARVAAQVAA
jgi:hypothetical protein